MMMIVFSSLLLLLPLVVDQVSAFGFIPSRGLLLAKKTPSVTLLYNNFANDNDGPPDNEPFFQMRQIPTATTSDRLDHVVECAEKGECDVEEMMAMIDELEELNAECEGTLSRECNLDAVAARNVLKVALASKVMLEEIMRQQAELEEFDEGYDPEDEDCYYDPYMAFNEMEDHCLDAQGGIHSIPTAALDKDDLDRIVQCAQDGDCPVGEMADMIDELERLNLECEGHISRECSLDAMEARNILKVALGSHAALAQEYEYKTRNTNKKGPTP